MDLKTEMINYLEKKIKGCEELEMKSEKWAFIQCLLEVKKLSALAEKPTSEPDKALDLFGVSCCFCPKCKSKISTTYNGGKFAYMYCKKCKTFFCEIDSPFK